MAQAEDMRASERRPELSDQLYDANEARQDSGRQCERLLLHLGTVEGDRPAHALVIKKDNLCQSPITELLKSVAIFHVQSMNVHARFWPKRVVLIDTTLRRLIPSENDRTLI